MNEHEEGRRARHLLSLCNIIIVPCININSLKDGNQLEVEQIWIIFDYFHSFETSHELYIVMYCHSIISHSIL